MLVLTGPPRTIPEHSHSPLVHLVTQLFLIFGPNNGVLIGMRVNALVLWNSGTTLKDKGRNCREKLYIKHAKLLIELHNVSGSTVKVVVMQIDEYLKRQSEWIRAEYMADYDIHDYPAISFASWATADDQLEIMNRTRSSPIQWLGATSADDKSRVLYYPDSNFRQLWVRHDLKGYRWVTINFLRKQLGVLGAIKSSLHADHLVPRAKFKGKYPAGVTVLYFIPSRANTSWGAGHEKRTKDRAEKIRGGVTLVSVAKAMGIDGVSKSKKRTYADVAQELINQGISSKEYADERFYGVYTQLQRVESELGCAADDPTVQPLKGKPTQIFHSERLIHAGAIKALRTRLPELMEKILSDNMVAKRGAVIDAWVTAHQRLDSNGQPAGLPLKSVFDLLLSDDQLFPMDQITKLVKQALTPRGAVAYLLDRTSVDGGANTFARHDVFQGRDYNWQG
jgi:hypothetical protein